jgi:hypothetical protein
MLQPLALRARRGSGSPLARSHCWAFSVGPLPNPGAPWADEPFSSFGSPVSHASSTFPLTKDPQIGFGIRHSALRIPRFSVDVVIERRELASLGTAVQAV